MDEEGGLAQELGVLSKAGLPLRVTIPEFSPFGRVSPRKLLGTPGPGRKWLLGGKAPV